MFLGRISLLILVLFSVVIAQLFDDMSYPELDFANSYFNDDTDPYEQDFGESDFLEEDDEDDKQGWTVVSEDEVADLVGRIEAAERHEQFAMDADHRSMVVTATTEEIPTATAEELENEGEDEVEEKSTTTPLQTVASLFSHLFSTSPSRNDEILETTRADATESESQNAKRASLNTETELSKAEELTDFSTTEGETVKLEPETLKPEEVIESERETPKISKPAANIEQKSIELDEETSDAEMAITKSVEEMINMKTEESKPIEITAELENMDEKSIEMESESSKSEELSSALETKTMQHLEDTVKTGGTSPVEINSQAPYSTEQEAESKILRAEDGTFSSLKTEVPSTEETVKAKTSISEEIKSKSKTESSEIIKPKQEDETKILKSEKTETVPEATKTEETTKNPTLEKTTLSLEKESSKLNEVTEETEEEIQERELTVESTLETTRVTEILRSEEINTESREPLQEELIVPAQTATVNNEELATSTQTAKENMQSPNQEETSLETTEEINATTTESL
ncbi:unnamed protein product [Hymenolepis diminuta]|uniref:SEA domain-containing protein n=1 Tax=Hymenolepis diminuta TaxID=6216 RepID=A0A0R3SG20_HYMDI|nr:unnamed protein product [Hymenolepis diminuta]